MNALPDFFPLAPKACAKPAAAFFDCFSEKGNQHTQSDPDAGAKGLAECAQTLAAYEQCMTRWRRKTPQPPLYRVPEEYRSSVSSSPQ
ncbi:hypothetical protein CTAYLR_006987 [Chrysophaeum taylorii]|uniref:Uncharacterized protein n=1 Tax=Chrysophaeum taylorii TaxID=2483200 RepID=A0AAD7UC00_9STRA|nr:hypothetical protein CTAYLR_006987 [Chrysophaeum taylorii]